MKKLLLALAALTGTAPLHGMESQQLSPISLPQTYHQFSKLLNKDVASHILSLQLGNVDLAKLPLEIEQSCQHPRNLVQRLKILIESCGYNLSAQLFKKYFPHEKISICDVKGGNGWTTLHYTASSGSRFNCYYPYTEIAQLLLDTAGKDAWTLLSMQDVGYNFSIDRGATALIDAAYQGNIEMVKIFLQYAGDKVWDLLTIQYVDYSSKILGWTALHRAGHSNKTKIMALLLDAAGDNAQDFASMKTYDGKTASDLAKEAQELMERVYAK